MLLLFTPILPSSKIYSCKTLIHSNGQYTPYEKKEIVGVVVSSHLKEGTCRFCYTARKSILKTYYFTEQNKVMGKNRKNGNKIQK